MEITAPTVQQVNECDYDVSCTPLYKAIELAEDEEDYAGILYFLETGKWSETETNVGPSPQIQARTWVSRFDTKDKTKMKWSQLPLHLAIVSGAPAQIVASLVSVYPDAVRCCDEQQMLPLHLALRYDAMDDIVAFLLLSFPEAVNAVGKHNRTSIEIALRADDKVRGIMLDIFSEQAITKTKKILSKEIEEIKKELKVARMELDDTKAKLEQKGTELEQANVKIDTLEKKLAEAEDIGIELHQKQLEAEVNFREKIDKVRTEKLVYEIETQRAIDGHIAATASKGESLKKAKDEITKLKEELDVLHKRVAESKSQKDWDELKMEVEDLRAFQLARVRDDAKSAILSLKVDLDKTAENSSKKDENLKSAEINVIKKNLERLQRSEGKAKTAPELTTIRLEVDALREQLNDKAEAKKTKLELTEMREAMELELKNAEGLSPEELSALRKVIDAHKITDLETKTAKELAQIKEEFNKLKKELKESEFEMKMKKEIEELKASLEKEAANANSNIKHEMVAMQAIVDNLQTSLVAKKSSDEVVAVAIKRELESLKEQFNKKREASKIELEVTLLKKMVESELNQAQGKTQEELLQIKKSLKELADHNLEEKNMQELKVIKGELNLVKDDLKQVEMISKTQQELENLKSNLEQEIRSSKGKTIEELTVMKKALVALNIDHIQSKNMKKTLESEIQKVNAKAEEELKQLKKEIDAINLEKLELKNQDAWEILHKEMDQLKVHMKQKQLDGMEQTKSELQALKDAVAGIDLAAVEKKRKSEYDEIKSQMEALQEQMARKEQEEKMLKKELDLVKNKIRNQKKRSMWGSQLARLYIPLKAAQEPVRKAESPKSTEKSNKTSVAAKVEESGIRTILPPGLAQRAEILRDNSSMNDSSRAEELRGQGRRNLMSMRSKSSIKESALNGDIKQMILDLNASKKNEILEDSSTDDLIRSPPSHSTVGEAREMPEYQILPTSSVTRDDTVQRSFSMRKVKSMSHDVAPTQKGILFGRAKSNTLVSEDGAEVEISLEEVRE